MEEGYSFHSLKTTNDLLKCKVQVHEFLEEAEIHLCSPCRCCASFPKSMGGFGYCRSHACCSSALRKRTLGAFSSMSRFSSISNTSLSSCTSSNIRFLCSR